MDARGHAVCIVFDSHAQVNYTRHRAVPSKTEVGKMCMKYMDMYPLKISVDIKPN
jgi:hypothetical protein